MKLHLFLEECKMSSVTWNILLGTKLSDDPYISEQKANDLILTFFTLFSVQNLNAQFNFTRHTANAGCVFKYHETFHIYF